ncbi:hypothetical protein A6V39_00350 [Candidatus Mycoplasma haematobovis]|uniref:Uncharacterized protein n=1 Tax=Candidatus Mycoplasma haematobovis TaxID=432608 RepID=A0A1A9QFM6_9MOLU|nr:hypothetical protein [Candidatus Mycoplasma haematobovis]OAL10500.1 hypothetical protein A6V39_00350 [Candidatus Mycoplasma haematobovis]
MLSTPKLVGMAVASVGIVGGAVGINYALNPSVPAPEKTTLRKLITSANRTPLNKDSTTWDIKLITYTNSIRSLKKITLTPEDAEGLKTWCTDNLDKEFEVSKKDESNYSIAIQICTKPTNQEKLKKNSKTVLTDSGWDTKANTYKKGNIENLTIPTISDKTKATEKQIKDWCTDTLGKEIEDNETIYNTVVKWCTTG